MNLLSKWVSVGALGSYLFTAGLAHAQSIGEGIGINQAYSQHKADCQSILDAK